MQLAVVRGIAFAADVVKASQKRVELFEILQTLHNSVMPRDWRRRQHKGSPVPDCHNGSFSTTQPLCSCFHAKHEENDKNLSNKEVLATGAEEQESCRTELGRSQLCSARFLP